MKCKYCGHAGNASGICEDCYNQQQIIKESIHTPKWRLYVLDELFKYSIGAKDE